MHNTKKRIFLSPPHMSGEEMKYIQEAFTTNWIAPFGSNIDMFEKDFCSVVGTCHAVALSSGTAALHLALILSDVKRDDEVICSTFTFAASANPIIYQGAIPIFVESDRSTWNMSPDFLRDAILDRKRKGKHPKALILVHLYGQCADINPILDLCSEHNIILIEDAAESLGSYYRGAHSGTLGRIGIFSFNGNKIITTSGGGMLVSDNESIAQKARFLANQARDPAPHYEHSIIGYNYRMSNILAGIGRGQLCVLSERVEARRRNFDCYQKALGELPGIEFMPQAGYGKSNRWLTCITIDPSKFGAANTDVCLRLEQDNIESRPLWKPLHLQPVFRDFPYYGDKTSEDLFCVGLCLPSGSNLSSEDLDRIVSIINETHRL